MRAKFPRIVHNGGASPPAKTQYPGVGEAVVSDGRGSGPACRSARETRPAIERLQGREPEFCDKK
jgi:hypothetical protein